MRDRVAEVAVVPACRCRLSRGVAPLSNQRPYSSMYTQDTSHQVKQTYSVSKNENFERVLVDYSKCLEISPSDVVFGVLRMVVS